MHNAMYFHRYFFASKDKHNVPAVDGETAASSSVQGTEVSTAVEDTPVDPGKMRFMLIYNAKSVDFLKIWSLSLPLIIAISFIKHPLNVFAKKSPTMFVSSSQLAKSFCNTQLEQTY